MEDIVPALLETIQKDFASQIEDSKKLQAALKLLADKKANYLDANNYAIEVGDILAKVLGVNITPEILPDGRMYFNIADRILNPTLQKNYDLIADFAKQVQTDLNKQAKINLKAQVPDLNQDRINGIINRLSDEPNFDDIAWILDDPIVNFTQNLL